VVVPVAPVVPVVPVLPMVPAVPEVPVPVVPDVSEVVPVELVVGVLPVTPVVGLPRSVMPAPLIDEPELLAPDVDMSPVSVDLQAARLRAMLAAAIMLIVVRFIVLPSVDV
jgi:hypothetical protein